MDTIQIAGKYASAEIFLDKVDSNVISQTMNILNHPMMENATVRLMPDTHLGAGVPIGFTAKLADDCDMIAPDLVGVDVGCGVLSYNIGRQTIDYKDFDNFVKKNIPSGFNVRNKISPKIKNNPLLEQVKEVSNKLGTQFGKVERNMLSVGTLGGGNHFLEIGQDENKDKWLTIHSGSRAFGLSICNYHNKQCDEKIVGIKTLSGSKTHDYFEDMKVAQKFASLSRQVMAWDVIEDYFGLEPKNLRKVHSVHNYFDFNDYTIRKGATPARKGEELVIPFNMRDGIVIGVGKGNVNWNNSSMHGSGRKMGRSAAKKRLHINEFKKQMEGIYSSGITQKFLDESPSAYKATNDILKYIPETFYITERVIPKYNFKG